MSQAPDANLVRVHFPLEQDDDGYPPYSVETLWAEERSDYYVVDSIAFFTDAVASLDRISAIPDEDGRLWFDAVVEFGGHAVIRVVSVDGFDALIPIRAHLRELGCTVESSAEHAAIAADVPPSADYAELTTWLDGIEDAGIAEWGEGAVHFLTTP